MSSILKVDQLQDSGGNAIITSDGSGNLTTQKTNYPAFEAQLSANQSIAENAFVKAELNTENFDTNNCYDNSTNYRFTPTVAGKYLVYGTLHIDTTSNSLIECRTAIYKNGSIYKEAARIVFSSTGYGNELSALNISYVIDFNGSSDYVELYGYLNANGSGTKRFLTDFYSVFGAYRIGS
jgi:hypothetical protein